MTLPENAPRLTIGMPVYNASAHIRDALDSLLSQTFTDFEIVISDNASTDDTPSICIEYANRDPRIRYVRQPINRGSTWNFNQVLHLARGAYFKWAAYDDVCESSYLERCVRILDEQPEVLWCHTRSRHIGINGELLNPNEAQPISYVERDRQRDARLQVTRASVQPTDRFKAVILGQDGCLDSYGVIRSDILRKTQLFLPIFGSEKVLMAELALWGRYHEIPEVLFFARIHPAAAGSQRTSKLQRQFINPLAKGLCDFSRLRMLRGYITAVRHSEIPWPDKIRCFGSIGRYLFQVHKWKAVIVKTLTGAGLAGEYPTAVPAQQSAKAC